MAGVDRESTQFAMATPQPARLLHFREMNRATMIAVVACLVILAGLTVGTVQLARQELARAEVEFAADRRRAVDAVAREMDKDFENLGEVLRYAGQLFRMASAPRDRERDLGSLVTVLKQYIVVAVYDTDGARLFDSAAPAAQIGPELRAAIDEVGQRALALPSGQIDASPPFTADGAAWFRVFATSFPTASGPQSVALLVDTQPMFAKVRLIVSEPQTRLLVLGAHGLPAPASAPVLAQKVIAPDARLPVYQLVVASMRVGEGGAMRVPAEEARLLGLGAAEVVAAWAAIPFHGGHWSVATLSSTALLREHEQAIVLRLAAAGSAIALCLILFAAYAVLATRRSIAMRERLRQAAQVAHLHEMTEKILENVPTGVLALSADGRITRVNRVLREKLADGALGGPLAGAFAAAPPSVVARLGGLIDAALAQGRVQSLHGEHLALFGKEGQYSLHAVPLEPHFPEARVLLVVEDLSEVRALESRLLRAEKLATVGVLAAGIAHEIGTPLGVVRGRAEYLQGKLPEAAGGMNIIIEQIDRVTRTIRELLDFARQKRPPTRNGARAAALAPVVRTVAELLRFEAERRDVAIDTGVSEELPLIDADPEELQQVLVNLVMNALDACAKGGHVEIRASAAAAARIEVIDDGCGIPDEHRHQVFDPFFTTKKRGQGTGLGLAIVAQIVSGHGGEIELESAVGKGTHVTVQWPLAKGVRGNAVAG